MKTYNIISRKNGLKARVTVFQSGNGVISLDRPVTRFYRFADRLEEEFPLRVEAASLSDGKVGHLAFVPTDKEKLVKDLLTSLNILLDSIGQ